MDHNQMDNSYLVLSRKAGESIRLQVPDSNGTVTEINIELIRTGVQNKIGIKAPRSVEILRHEIVPVNED